MTPSTPSHSSKPVWFPGWAEAFRQVRLPPLVQQQQRMAIIEYLRFLKQTRQIATVESARQFMAQLQTERQLTASQLDDWKDGIRWFFREGARQGEASGNGCPKQRVAQRSNAVVNVMTDIPTLGAADVGASGWEQRLVRELRGRHYRWRTEQTYRMWARRFAEWLANRQGQVEQAGADQVRAFLSELATRQRVTASTQKQALNALVFLLREALGLDLGEFGDFARARKAVRIPVVLSRTECRQLFAALDGTTRLMAELMYGSGLRLTELIGLRVKDVDLERCQIVGWDRRPSRRARASGCRSARCASDRGCRSGSDRRSRHRC